MGRRKGSDSKIHRLTPFSQNISLKWDGQYQLTSASLVTSVVNYSYDVLGRRVSHTVVGGGDPGSTNTEFFIYDGNQVVADVSTNGVVLRTYVWGPGIDNLLSLTTYGAETNTYCVVKDLLNSVHALVDGSGNIVESYEYDAWGRVLDMKDAFGNSIANHQSAIGNRYFWQGREYDAVTALYYFRARWYDPVSGRWLSNDPVGISGGLNQYVFCGNNVVNFVDPFGLYVTVSRYPGASGLGHVGIGVNSPNTTGFYPAPNASKFLVVIGQPVPGVMQPDMQTPIVTVAIPTTPQQDQVVQDFINQRINNPGNYDLNDRNCATTVRDALNTGGINIPRTILPRTLIKDLQQQFPTRRP